MGALCTVFAQLAKYAQTMHQYWWDVQNTHNLLQRLSQLIIGNGFQEKGGLRNVVYCLRTRNIAAKVNSPPTCTDIQEYVIKTDRLFTEVFLRYELKDWCRYCDHIKHSRYLWCKSGFVIKKTNQVSKPISTKWRVRGMNITSFQPDRLPFSFSSFFFCFSFGSPFI